ncbi:MAG: hypothetical protein N2V75_00440 [Methanophagales archaeon]|nr:hypothetical protein [Methanophagales archaeon]
MMYCPKCHRFVAEEEHVFSDRIEYRCPHCGHRIEVVYKPLRPGWWRDGVRTV